MTKIKQPLKKTHVKKGELIEERNITDGVLKQIKKLEDDGNIQFPKNYSYVNALKSAWLMLQTVKDKNDAAALSVCKQETVANSLLDMVIQGLSPAKKQCYFIVYGTTLSLSRSYMGTVAVTKRIEEVEDVYANVIYKDDTFQYKINLATGLKEIIKHEQDFKNIDITKIDGVYCVVTRKDKPSIVEVMNIKQVQLAWGQGQVYSSGNSKSHKNFTDEMAKKTVINRACKLIYNSSNDSDVLVEAINKTTEAEYTNIDEIENDTQSKVDDKANSEEIDFEEIPKNQDDDKIKNDLFPSDEEKEEIEKKELDENKVERNY